MIPVNRPTIYGEEIEFVIESLKAGWISSESPYLIEFEKQMAAFSNRAFGIAVSNGTAALEIAVRALGISAGDEVILPSFTIISCAQAVTKIGAVPILIDSEAGSWNMDIKKLESKITKATKAIMVVHMYGLTTDMNQILTIARKHGLYVIEDASEAIGQTWNGEPCGSFGDISTMSFYANKHISTGEGGMILTNNISLNEKSRYLRNLCFSPERRFKHEEIGWNYRMSGLQAAFGLGQLKNIKKTIDRKREIGSIYNSVIPNSSKYQKPQTENSGSSNCYWVYGIFLNPHGTLKADLVMKELEKKGVST